MSEICIHPGVKIKMTNVAPGGANPSPAVKDSVIPVLCVNAMIDKKPILTTTLSWVASGCTFPPNTHTAGGGAIMASKAKKTTFMKQKPLVKGDSGFCSGAFVNPMTGAPIPCSCKFEIEDAGQTKVKEK